MRFHTNLPVHDLEQTEAFYRQLFGTAPTKRKTDYLKFIAPGLNIAFHPADDDHIALARGLHLGFEVQDPVALEEIHKRLKEAGLISVERQRSVCCYARQDKFWVTDPSGYQWELYYLVDDTEYRSETASRAAPTTAMTAKPA